MFKKQFSEVEDACALAYPFAGTRMLRGLLALQGCKIGRRHVKALMRMTKPKPGHKIYPVSAARYGDHAAEPGLGDGHHLHPDGAWLRLSRCRAGLGDPPGSVLGLSITMEAAFCVETLEDALARHGKPGIFNTDQGSQFTGAAFTGLLAGCSPSAPLRQIEGLHEGRVSGSS